MELLFRTIHGSRLYGLSHVDSDYDYFEVYGFDKQRSRQRIAGTDDRTKVSYDKFMLGCEKGVPQFLEAMFSNHADFDNMPFDRRLYYNPGMTKVRDTYMRTIKSFWNSGVEENNFKKKRHAMRLVLNLREMQGNGRFNPTLTPMQALWVNQHAALPEMTEVL